jgi:hypothetical protein
MPRYGVDLARTASTTASVGSLVSAATTKRIRIQRLIFGFTGTPGDAASLWTLSRATAAGTSTAKTPKPLDMADPACTTVAGENHTVEPTYTANETLLSVPLHQRATFHLEFAPGREIVTPATSAAGLGIRTPTAPAIACNANVHFEE